MSKEKIEQIIDDAYKNYLGKRTSANRDNINEPHTLANGMVGKVSRPYTQEEFINKIKTNSEFSETWGLQIEDRELSREERVDLYISKYDAIDGFNYNQYKHTIPTKLITITYNNETITSYE